jgi:hypothetical protein
MMPNIDIWYRALKAYLYIRKMCDTKYGIAAYDRSDTELNGLFKIVHTTCTRLTQLYSSEGIIIDLFEKISEALEQWKTITSGNIKQRILTAPIETLFPSGIPDNVDFQYPGNYSGSHQGTLISSFKHLSNFNEQQALQLVCNNYQRRYGMPLFQEAFLRAQKLGLVEFRYQMFCSLRRPHTSHGYYENPENRLGLSVQMVIKSTGVVIELTRAQHGAGAMRGEMLDDLRRELDGSGPNWNPIRGGIAKSAKQIGPINTLIQTCQNTGIADHPNAELDNAISQCALLKAYLQINDIKFQKSGASACINAVEALFTNLKANVHSPDINLIEELGTEIETTQRAFNEFFEQLKDRSYSLTAIQVENQEEERMAPPLRDQLLQMAQSARQELIIYYHARNLKQHDLSNQKKQWRRCYNPITNPTSAMRCKGIWNKMSEPVVGSLSLLTVITALAYFIRSASDMALLRMALLRAVSTTLVCFGLFICLIQNCNKKNQQSEVHAHSTARI